MKNSKKGKINSIQKRPTHGKQGLYQSAIKYSPSGFAHLKVIYNKDKKIENLEFIEVNKSFEKLLKINNSSVIGRKVTDILPEMDMTKDTWMEIINDINLHKNVREFNHYLNESNRWLHITIFSPGKNQIVKQLQPFSLTDSIELEKKLREKNIMLESILDNAPVGIWITYPSNEPPFSNKYVE